MAESLEATLRVLTAQTGENPEQLYAKWAALPMSGGDSLEALVRRKLIANGKSAQLRESLLETLRAGGAVGETVEQVLLKSGLTGWS